MQPALPGDSSSCAWTPAVVEASQPHQASQCLPPAVRVTTEALKGWPWRGRASGTQVRLLLACYSPILHVDTAAHSSLAYLVNTLKAALPLRAVGRVAVRTGQCLT